MRNATITRETKETIIRVALNLDGKGKYEIETGIPFFNHMLELFSRHGGFDMVIKAEGDVTVDFHHTVEDVGITLGQALDQALGKREKIQRYGWAAVPMDEAFTLSSVDVSGRPYLILDFQPGSLSAGNFPLVLLESFFTALTTHAKLTLHIYPKKGRDPHHVAESIFKSVARALREAVSIDPRSEGVPSTKGRLREE